MKHRNFVVLAAALALTSGGWLQADEDSPPNSDAKSAAPESALNSIATSLVLLTDEIRELRCDNQRLDRELKTIKARLDGSPNGSDDKAKVTATYFKRVDESGKRIYDGSPESFIEALRDSRSDLCLNRLQMFTEIVNVEVAAIEYAVAIEGAKGGMARNLNVADAELRKSREANFRDSYERATEGHKQLMDQVAALNIELSVVVKKIEHLDQRIKEAESLNR